MAAAGFAPPKLKDFILTEKLGSGTYATVYKAFRKTDSREAVAVKVVSKKSLNKSSMENLLTEIEILKTVRHPHIVQLKDFQWDSENIYLILEWCSGGDLSRFIRSRRILPERVARRCLQQIACALQFLHEKNISHLDLKPQNILLSGNMLKLADFGFAQYMSPWDEQHALRGSPLYMAPEIVCRKHYDARVDLWSVGVILYEALFGRAPFASRSFTELEEKIRSEKPVGGESQHLYTAQGFIYRYPACILSAAPRWGSSSGHCCNEREESGAEDYDTLDLYQQSLGEMLLALAAEAQGRRRELLHSEIKSLMSRAEYLKELIKMRETQTDESLKKDAAAESVRSSCCLQ
ncbi:serine/threonine-protein kinase ULK3 [Danio aesculapii]|uniref:serine/threonine-protein kinase ULK3 n=1 Tax=Danio aesculapii TaxID=1142201 RepID=UPI0024C05ABE|nr:serine/threonine-protein kinase ULK3 [Danio aesculapii]